MSDDIEVVSEKENGESDSSKEDETFNVRCSNSCARSGLTLLLFSALAISILQPLTRMKAFDALDKYVTLRLELRETVEHIKMDDCWRTLAKDGRGLKWSPNKLKDYNCLAAPKIDSEVSKGNLKTPGGNSTIPKRAEKPAPPSGLGIVQKEIREMDKPGEKPAPPTGLRIVEETIREMDHICKLILELNNYELLQLASSYSYRFSRGISRWESYEREIISSRFETDEELTPPKNMSIKEAENYNFLVIYYPFEKIMEIANYELPEK